MRFQGAATAVVLAALAAFPAFAAEQAEPDSGASSVADIVVTAQRREQSLQKVPIAVTALSADALSKGGIAGMASLDQLTPGLLSTTSAGAPQRYLRGVGAQTVALYEQPVATYVDGVYIASASGSVFNFNNIERIEVLRGPQGTLFGRNATGGVIQVVTRKPETDETEVRVKASYDSYDTVELGFFANAGLSDKAAINFAGYYNDQNKGYGRNLFTRKRVNKQQDAAMRGQLLLQPFENLTLRYSGDYTRQKADFGLTRDVAIGSRNALGRGKSGGFQDVNYDTDAVAKNRQYGVTQDALWEFADDISLRSITAYRKYKFYALYDTDVVPVNILNAQRFENGKTFQQEFLLSGQTDRLTYTGGLFYFTVRSSQEPVATFGTNAAGNIDRFSDQTVHSYAAYAQGTYALTDSLNFTAGGRYTVDKGKIDGFFVSRTGFPGGAGIVVQRATNRKFTTKKPTWHFGLDYQVTSDVLAYGSVSRGFKSGAFNNGNLTQPATRPEVLDAYEVGLKTDLFDRTLRFNVSAFHYDYKDIQLNSVNLPNILLLNAAGAKVDGAEIEWVAAPRVPVGKLRFGGALSLLDGKYKSFPNAQFYLPNPYTTVPAGLTCAAPTSASPGGNTNCSFDASGNRMIRSPKWTLNLDLDYSFPVGVGDLGFHGNMFHNDGFYWEPSNRTHQSSYTIYNADISLTLNNPNVVLKIFGKNLSNAKYLSSLSESGVGDVATPQPPRVFGVAVDYRFGGK